MERPKLKVLALHSFRTSGDIFRQQMQRAKLMAKLDDILDVDYINAPHAATGTAPDVTPFFPGPYYEWSNAMKNEATGEWEYHGIHATIEYVLQRAQTHGPYDGIMAMSQGTIATTLLLSRRLSLPSQAQTDDGLGRFALFFSGAMPRISLQAGSDAQKIDVPSLHCIGDRDPIKHASFRLLEKYQNPLSLIHPRGHVVPALEGEQYDKLRAFLESQQTGSGL